MRKLIEFKGLVVRIQDYANKHCEGNFSLAVRHLVRVGLRNDADVYE